MNLSIFILAAGLGERLLPITDYIPKPLVPILGKSVLQSILEKVSNLPTVKIGINLHHKKDVIEKWIKQSVFSEKVEIFPEDPMLGTGGALKNAEAFLSESTFLVHNSDIISDIDLEKLIEFHHSSTNLVALAVHDYPEFNVLEVDEKGFLKGVLRHPHLNPPPSTSPSPKYLAFTGIAVYSPEFLRFLPSGFSSVVDAWLKAVQQGYKIGTLDVTGCYWSDIGTQISYAKAVIEELKKSGEMVYIHPSVTGCKHFELDGYVVIEKENFLNKGISIRNCIILPGTKIEREGAEENPSIPPLIKGDKGRLLIENCILGPGFKIDLNETELLGLSRQNDAVLIGTGGSDRKYYRIKRHEHSVVLMQCGEGDHDFQRHIEYTLFFQNYSIPVPRLIEVKHSSKSALFEDLGDLSLYSWLHCPREQEEIEKIYKRVIDMLVLINEVATDHISEYPLLQNRIFDYEHLRWETNYFIERFVEGIRNIKVNNLPALEDEFHRLAMKVDSFHKTLIHRDFQSQNIMITKGEIPRLLDYQGARIGPPAYDVVSVLWDPYYRLKDNVRERLLDYYVDKIKKAYTDKKGKANNPTLPPFNSPLSKGGYRGVKGEQDGYEIIAKEFNEKEFKETLLPCRLQRHIQALGAYGFLSSIKGKKYFLKHVPEGLRLLKEDIFLSKDEYPVLYDLITEL